MDNKGLGVIEILLLIAILVVVVLALVEICRLPALGFILIPV